MISSFTEARAFVRAGLFLCCGLSSCASGTFVERSAMDTAYVAGASEGTQGDSALVSMYQHGLSSALGSNCRMYPSDSRYFRRSVGCGVTKAALRTLERFNEELSGQALGYPVAPIDGEFKFVDPPLECEAGG